MTLLVPVILCGGSGSRLWPLSRELHPKQFITFDGDTLFGQTLERTSSLPGATQPIVVCNDLHRFFVSGIARQKDKPVSILLEPISRNTCPAITMAALAAIEDGEDPLLLVLPSDHSIPSNEAFVTSVASAVPGAEKNLLFTFGIVPNAPETGYGYIQQGAPLPEGGYKVARFVEKPDTKTAEAFLKNGGYTWNSGIFLFRASVFLAELEHLAPKMAEGCRAAWKTRSQDREFTRFSPKAFAAIPANSIDYAVMEHTDRAGIVELATHWNDLGSWSAFYNEANHDDAGNATVGDVVLHGAQDCYVHSSHRLVAAMDVKNIAIVETADAVLVINRDKTQRVKDLLGILKESKRSEAETHLHVYRPWGSYEILSQGDGFQVKRITVNPGSSLSSQYHLHRAEHWVVVRGVATISNGNNTFSLKEGESTYIPIGNVHRLENKNDAPLEIIEVQTGNYLGEDDIVRLDDIYGRN